MKTTPPIPRRLLVILPSWLGDVVMSTPTLRALRALFPQARITYLLKEYVRPLVDALPWHDRLIVVRPKDPSRPAARRMSLAARLRRKNFDMTVLLPNSFRSALLVSTAGIPRRVGYDRDGRALLLTDRLLPVKERGEFVPISAVDYYLGLARYLGAESPDRRPQLFTHPKDDERAEQLLRAAGVVPGDATVMLNPGAATKGDLKLWPADRFAALADSLFERHGARVLVNGSPKERAVLDAVHAAAKHPLIDLQKAGSDLTLLKSILRRCSLLVTNDTGARHIAAAVSTPVIGLFGPTDPRWARLDFERDYIIQGDDGTMRSISIESVVRAADEVLQHARPLISHS